MANLYDINVDYTMNPHASVTAYWGYAVGGGVVESIYPMKKNASLGFVELNYKF